MLIVDIIQILLLVFFGFLITYQAFLGLVAFRVKEVTDIDTTKKHKFAIVIPAHNEEKMIAKTIYSLNGIVYPQSHFEIFVIADNCTDCTAEIAKELGANVLERYNVEKRGKGYALRWGFDRILAEHQDIDAVVVIDSDSLVSGNYLKVMNHYLNEGHRVLQSSDLVLPQPGNWSSESTRLGFLLVNYVRPMGRKYLGLNMGLRGNGMCFSTEVLKAIPWQSWALAEDLEYGLILILKGEQIHFAQEAYVWAQMPLQSSNAESQRKRWEQGRKDISRTYAGVFLKEAIKQRSLKYLDVCIDLMTPPFLNSMMAVAFMIVVSAVYAYFTPENLLMFWLWTGLFAIGIMHLFLGLLLVKADKNLYKSLLYIPVYALWKIKVAVKSLFTGREIHWIRTTRDS